MEFTFLRVIAIAGLSVLFSSLSEAKNLITDRQANIIRGVSVLMIEDINESEYYQKNGVLLITPDGKKELAPVPLTQEMEQLYQDLMVVYAQKGINSNSAYAVQQLPNAGWIIYGSIMMSYVAPAEFCLTYDKECQEATQNDTIPYDPNLTEDSHELEAKAFEQLRLISGEG